MNRMNTHYLFGIGFLRHKIYQESAFFCIFTASKPLSTVGETFNLLYFGFIRLYYAMPLLHHTYGTHFYGKLLTALIVFNQIRQAIKSSRSFLKNILFQPAQLSDLNKGLIFKNIFGQHLCIDKFECRI